MLHAVQRRILHDEVVDHGAQVTPHVTLVHFHFVLPIHRVKHLLLPWEVVNPVLHALLKGDVETKVNHSRGFTLRVVVAPHEITRVSQGHIAKGSMNSGSCILIVIVIPWHIVVHTSI